MSNIFEIDCINSQCGSGLLRGAGNNPNGCLPKVDESTVDSVIILDKVNGNFVTWSASMGIADWDIDNSDDTGTKLKRFIGKGEVSTEDGKEYESAAGVYSTGDKKYTLKIEIPISNKALRDYFRAMDCGDFKPSFYYTTTSKHVFGGKNAITPNRVKVTLDLKQDDFQKVILELQWSAKTAPDRENSPLPSASEL